MTTNDSGDITDGGHAPSGGDAIGTGNDARIALLNSIGDSYDNIRADDLADINDDGSTSQFVPPLMDDGELQLQPQPETEVEDRLEVDPPTQMITRKVNGKDVTLPLEDWLIRAQKVESADEYLVDAARQRKEARAAEQHQPPPPPTVPQGPSKEELAAQQLAKRRELARAIQMGTEEEAVAAIEQLQNTTSASALTVEDVGRVADERLRFNSALTWFANEYKDLTTNPQLYKMAVEREAALVQSGDARPYGERYREVGDSVRAWRDELIGSAKPAAAISDAPGASLGAKRAAKAAAPKPPTSASTKATPAPQDEDDESASSVIAAMAKARGGPQWARG